MGQVHDTSQDLVYLNNRYHDPELGLFISVDPLVVSTNEPYVYASANPSTWSDPTGLETFGDLSSEGFAQLTRTAVALDAATTSQKWDVARKMSAERRSKVVGNARRKSGHRQLEAVRDSTLWEIDSNRIPRSGDGGSDWWRTVNGGMVVDLEAAMELSKMGIRSVESPLVQKWLAFLNAEEGSSDIDALFWDAHQYSLHSAAGFATRYLDSETTNEQEFIQVVLDNVDFTASSVISPAALFGEGLGFGINSILRYPDTYPSTQPPEWSAMTSYSDVLLQLAGAANRNRLPSLNPLPGAGW